jgi:hypothetical protein
MAGIIRKCYGCGQAFSERYRNAPNDLVLKIYDHRIYLSARSKIPKHSASLQNTYFHYQSQPLLTNIVRNQRHDDQENEPMSMLTTIEDLGEETIIGGLSSEQEADKLDIINEEA